MKTIPKIRIYNTLTDSKELFVPEAGNKVRIYVCGPTVYDSAHLGHARAAVSFDVIQRFLRKMGYDVTYVRNFTDVDDKIINRANELGVDPREIAQKYIEEYRQDMASLNVQRPDVEPKVTEHIPQIIELIQKIIDKGYGYISDGNVFFSVRKFRGYGKLSKRTLENMLEGVRIDINEKKRDPLDFALWKKAKPQEPSWDSPWGPGRPGWHIECSAMSMEYLGCNFEIHGGGKDLIFPHHENEIAQSESAVCDNFARYWIHNGLIQINSEKMSKSLGNYFTVRNAIKQWSGESIRLFFLSHHYNNPADFSEKVMDDTEAAVIRIYKTLKRAKDLKKETKTVDEELKSATERFRKEWMEAMCDNFNTADAVGHLFELIRAINRSLDSKGWTSTMADTLESLNDFSETLGILTTAPEEFLKEKTLDVSSTGMSPEEIEKLIEERAVARKNKDWAKADQIRDYLKTKGIVLEDKPDGTTIWSVDR